MRRAIFSVILVFMLGILFQPVTAKAAREDDIVALMNDARARQGLTAVSIDQTLTNVAETRAVECSKKFSHIRPNGKAWHTVSAATNAENLAHAVNDAQQSPENVVLAWLLSPTHKANVMRKNCTGVGIAYYKGANGETYIVCEFN
ncbi:CAP domain-containing protein [Butyrivibrio sp. NC2007]|uniref:CAP domain-containing protein n=1 Tax=Butyrivibrio sp. NC2007 TaxID=1280683 RepID=UPI0003B36EFD|nr:CAP domain-containing protein [Butyrivibrio sp. NC2007]